MGGFNRVVSRAAIAFVLVASLTALVPTAPVSAAPAEGIIVSDGSGDVNALLPASGVPVPSGEAFDITEVKLYRETGIAVELQVKINNIRGAGQTGATTFGACFTWNEKLYGVKVAYVLAQPEPTDRKFGPLNGNCDPTAELPFASPGYVFPPVLIDKNANQISLILDRSLMGNMSKASPPAAGESIKDFRAFMTDGQRRRIDTAPNTGVADGSLTFKTGTANRGVKATVDSNLSSHLRCPGEAPRATYAIQAGGKRGVPVRLANPDASDRTINLQVETFTGEDWKPALLPKIEVPGASDGGPGNVTVNVIVDTPAVAKHKQCATLRVRGTDPADAAVNAEAVFNVISVNPPGPQARKLFLHANEDAENACSDDDIWMNTLESDPDDAKKEVLMLECRDPTPVSSIPMGFTTHIDVNPSHDLVVNTSAVGAKAVATLVMRSDGAPTTARIEVTAVAGRTVLQALGQGRVTAQLSSALTPVRVEIPIDFTRDSVASGDPSRIVEAADGIGMVLRYTPLPPDNAVPVPTAGRVTWAVSQSSLELPIYATIKRNVNDPGAGGSLLSISANGVLPEFASPGGLRLFEFAILNEGAKPDVALVAAALNGPAGWTAEVFPAGPIQLEPGARAVVQIGVTPRPEAEESESSLLDVVVTSQQDPTARASMSTRIVATREGGVMADDAPLADEVKKDGGLVPGPSLALVLALVAFLGVALRRRL